MNKIRPEPPPLKIPDPNCKHEQFSGTLDCNRITRSDSPNAVPYLFNACVRIQCAKCGGDFMFTGLPWGILLTEPCLNVAGTEATLPMKPYDGTLSTGTCKVEMPKP